MTWPFENDTGAIIKKLASAQLKKERLKKLFTIIATDPQTGIGRIAGRGYGPPSGLKDAADGGPALYGRRVCPLHLFRNALRRAFVQGIQRNECFWRGELSFPGLGNGGIFRPDACRSDCFFICNDQAAAQSVAGRANPGIVIGTKE